MAKKNVTPPRQAPASFDRQARDLFQPGQVAAATSYSTPPPLPKVALPQVTPADAGRGDAAGVFEGWHHVAYQLVFSTGQGIEVRGSGIVGREPNDAHGSYVHVLRFEDPQRVLSRNHFEFGLTAENEFWAADLDSANGTYIVQNGAQRLLTAHERTRLLHGDKLHFGGVAAQLVIVPVAGKGK